MKRIFTVLMFVLISILFVGVDAQEIIEDDKPIAFPGAEGFGRYTTGGRGGRVIYVTNLNNSGAGSFRQAVEVERGPRIVMFKVSGVIELNSRINIKNGDLTIAGQTAPGEGIVLKNYTTYVGADNVIIRFIRFRLGDEKGTEDDSTWGRRQKDIIIDHCTMSWSSDEIASFYDNKNFTLQWSLLSESLRVSVHGKGTHGYTGIWGGQKASFHHNLIAHSDSRNPRFCGSRYTGRADLEHVDFRNNVIYNWGGNSGYAGEGGSYNMVNNYYKPGPASRNRGRIFQPYADNGKNTQVAGVWGTFYVDGNYNTENVGGVNSNNWNGIHPNPSSKSKNDLRSNTEFDMGLITTHSAEDAFEAVLGYAGASYFRDAIDERIVEETRNGTYTYTGSNGSTNGLIDSHTDAEGFIAYQTATAPVDTDGDGMPDDWEIANGLNSNDASDGSAYTLHNHFTNVEMYINSLVNPIMWAGLVNGVANYVESQPVSIKRVALEEKSVISPNPFNNILNVVANKEINRVVIYSLSGRVLLSKDINSNEATVDLSTLHKGVYLAEVVYADGTRENQKIVKK